MKTLILLALLLPAICGAQTKAVLPEPTPCLGRRGPSNLLADMGERPAAGYSLDRIDNDGNYERENCRWASRTQQMNNMGANVRYEFRGERKTLAELGRMCGKDYKLLSNRIRRGWSVERAITERVHSLKEK